MSHGSESGIQDTHRGHLELVPKLDPEGPPFLRDGVLDILHAGGRGIPLVENVVDGSRKVKTAEEIAAVDGSVK